METGAFKKVGEYTISLDPPLGQGAYGIVYKGSRTTKKTELVAAKRSRWEKELITEEADHEANLMTSIPAHNNITKFIDYIKLDSVESDIEYIDMWLILEYCSLKDLSIFARRFVLLFPQKLDIMLQCSRGLHHLHSQKPAVIHRDIKPQNILVSGSSTLPIFKLADFGISRLFERLPQYTLNSMTADMGSMPYMAPELFSKKPRYNESVDVYSFGVSSLTLLCTEPGKHLKAITVEEKEIGRYMYEKGMTEIDELRVKPEDGLYMTRTKTIIGEMIDRDPRSRPSAGELVVRFTRLCSPNKDVWRSVKQYDAAKSTVEVVEVPTSETTLSSTEATSETTLSSTEATATYSDVTVKPQTGSGVPPILIPIVHHELSSEASWDAGFSSNGSVVLASESEPSNLYLYRYIDAKYKLVYEMPLPSGLGSHCNKAANNTAIALQGYSNAITHHYSHSLDHLRTSKHEGELLDRLDDDGTTAYARRLSDSDCFVVAMCGSNEKRALVLQPPAGCAWTRWLSVCKLRDEFFVVNEESKTLTVFSNEGQVVSHSALPYCPTSVKAVTALGDRHVAVACRSPPSIHVYTRDAGHVTRISAQTLQLRGSADNLRGIRYSNSGTLHVAAGGPGTISSLHAYQVEFSSTS